MPAQTVRVPLSLLRDPARFGGSVEGEYAVGVPAMESGRVVSLAPSAADAAPAVLLTPPLVEAHCHLDKCFTLDRLDSAGSTLREAIDAQERDKGNWTAADLAMRMERGLGELVRAGVGAVRTHLDCADDPAGLSLAWSVLGDLAADWRDRIAIERVALIGIDAYSDPEAARRIARRVAEDGGVIGAFVYDQPGRKQALATLLDAARRAGVSVDLHIDEGLDVELDNIATVARLVRGTGHDLPVTLSHACSLMNREGDALRTRLDLIHEAALGVVALPASNLYLQARGNGTPDRRGITRIRELRETGIPVAIGTDNVRDAFSAVGAHDPLASLGLAVVAAHLDPPLGRWLPLVTHEAARALGHAPVLIEDCPAERLLLWEADSVSGLLSGRPRLTRFRS